jgi:anti-sigma B factor antagonist
MNLPTEIFGDVVVVHTPEELSADNAKELYQFLSGLDRVKVIVDLDGTETLDSAGLATLLDVQDGLREDEGDLKVMTCNSINRKIFEITRLDQQLEVFDNVIDAVKSFI